MWRDAVHPAHPIDPVPAHALGGPDDGQGDQPAHHGAAGRGGASARAPAVPTTAAGAARSAPAGANFGNGRRGAVRGGDQSDASMRGERV